MLNEATERPILACGNVDQSTMMELPKFMPLQSVKWSLVISQFSCNTHTISRIFDRHGKISA